MNYLVFLLKAYIHTCKKQYGMFTRDMVCESKLKTYSLWGKVFNYHVLASEMKTKNRTNIGIEHTM